MDASGDLVPLTFWTETDLYRNYVLNEMRRIARLMMEALEIAFSLCNATCPQYGYYKIFDIVHQIIPTAYVYNTSYWVYYKDEYGRCPCICNRFNIPCPHVLNGSQWIDMAPVFAEPFLLCKFPDRVRILSTNVNVHINEGVLKDFSITIQLFHQRSSQWLFPGDNTCYTTLIEQRYNTLSDVSQFVFVPVNFTPHPITNPQYGSLMRELVVYRSFLCPYDMAFNIGNIYTIVRVNEDPLLRMAPVGLRNLCPVSSPNAPKLETYKRTKRSDAKKGPQANKAPVNNLVLPNINQMWNIGNGENMVLNPMHMTTGPNHEIITQQPPNTQQPTHPPPPYPGYYRCTPQSSSCASRPPPPPYQPNRINRPETGAIPKQPPIETKSKAKKIVRFEEEVTYFHEKLQEKTGLPDSTTALQGVPENQRLAQSTESNFDSEIAKLDMIEASYQNSKKLEVPASDPPPDLSTPLVMDLDAQLSSIFEDINGEIIISDEEL